MDSNIPAFPDFSTTMQDPQGWARTRYLLDGRLLGAIYLIGLRDRLELAGAPPPSHAGLCHLTWEFRDGTPSLTLQVYYRRVRLSFNSLEPKWPDPNAWEDFETLVTFLKAHGDPQAKTLMYGPSRDDADQQPNGPVEWRNFPEVMYTPS